MKKCVSSFKTIQRLYRVGKEYKQFQKIRKSVREIQRAIRRKLARERMNKLRKGAIKVQAYWRKCYYQSKYRMIIKSAKLVNRVARGFLTRLAALRLKKVKAIIEVR